MERHELKEFCDTLRQYKELVKALDKVTKELELGELELQRRAIEELKKKGYEVIPPPQPTMPYGIPDIIATKEKEGSVTERLVIEVKGIDNPLANKLHKYEMGEMETPLPLKKRIVLVLPVIDGENFEVWGLKQIGKIKQEIRKVTTEKILTV